MLNGIQAPCTCEIDPRPRKMLMDMGIGELAGKAWERGLEPRIVWRALNVPQDDAALGAP